MTKTRDEVVDVVKTPEFDKACRMYKQGLGGINDIAHSSPLRYHPSGVTVKMRREVSTFLYGWLMGFSGLRG